MKRLETYIPKRKMIKLWSGEAYRGGGVKLLGVTYQGLKQGDEVMMGVDDKTSYIIDYIDNRGVNLVYYIS